MTTVDYRYIFESMKALHHIYSLTNSRAEMFTTDLGLAAYQGNRDQIRQALEKGIDWTTEGEYLLSSAIFGHQWDIARDILKGGMPISDSVYKEIYYWADHSLLNELPSNPDFLESLKTETQRNEFISAIINGDSNKVEELFRSEWINFESDTLGDHASWRPLHYAAQNCDLELLEFLLEAGAEVNALTGDKKTALVLVSRCPSVEKNLRKKCFKLLSSYGGKMIPPADGWFENWRLSRGGLKSN